MEKNTIVPGPPLPVCDWCGIDYNGRWRPCADCAKSPLYEYRRCYLYPEYYFPESREKPTTRYQNKYGELRSEQKVGLKINLPSCGQSQDVSREKAATRYQHKYGELRIERKLRFKTNLPSCGQSQDRRGKPTTRYQHKYGELRIEGKLRFKTNLPSCGQSQDAKENSTASDESKSDKKEEGICSNHCTSELAQDHIFAQVVPEHHMEGQSLTNFNTGTSFASAQISLQKEFFSQVTHSVNSPKTYMLVRRE